MKPTLAKPSLSVNSPTESSRPSVGRPPITAVAVRTCTRRRDFFLSFANSACECIVAKKRARSRLCANFEQNVRAQEASKCRPVLAAFGRAVAVCKKRALLQKADVCMDVCQTPLLHGCLNACLAFISRHFLATFKVQNGTRGAALGPHTVPKCLQISFPYDDC